ncbi:hypothetical protein Tco_1489794 [Tanacetum coccineum]
MQLESFRKTLLMSLQDEDGSSAREQYSSHQLLLAFKNRFNYTDEISMLWDRLRLAEKGYSVVLPEKLETKKWNVLRSESSLYS